MKFFFLFLMSFNLFAQDCPPDMLSVEFTSPITKARKITCGYMKNDSMVKHGPEKEFDRNGTLVKTRFFKDGKESDAPPQLPGADEVKVSDSETDESLAVIAQLLKVLTFEKGSLNEGEFKVHKCDSEPKTWVKAALTSSAVQKTYSFNDHCDVAGTFTASFTEEFPVSFDLRHLKKFTKTNMKVQMKINQAKSGIRYHFDVIEGTVSGEGKTVHFTVVYEVDIDPLTGSTNYSSQDGKITLTRIGDKTISVTRPLLFGR